MRNKNINFDEIELQARRLASMGEVFATAAVYWKFPAASLAPALDLFEHADDVDTLMMHNKAELQQNEEARNTECE